MNGRLQEGFSLLEVVVAFAITVITLSVLSQIFGQGARHLAMSEKYGEALLVAENLLAEYGNPVSDAAAEFQDDDEKFRWRVTLTPYGGASKNERSASATQTPLGSLRLVNIAVTVDWNTRGSAGSVTLESLRLVVGDADAGLDHRTL